MMIAKMLTAFYVTYILKKTELMKKDELKKRNFIYFFLALLVISDTQVKMFNYSLDILLMGIIIVLLEILLKYLKIKTKYILLKIYIVLLSVILIYRGGLWILQLL